MAYTVTRSNPPAVIMVRIQKAQGGGWVTCPLLAIRLGWVQVDDGLGPLWVMPEHVHPDDWPKLVAFGGGSWAESGVNRRKR